MIKRNLAPHPRWFLYIVCAMFVSSMALLINEIANIKDSNGSPLFAIFQFLLASYWAHFVLNYSALVPEE